MQPSLEPPLIPTRRVVLLSGAAAALLPVATPIANATPDEMRAAIAEITAGRAVRDGRVRLEMPELAENGNSVPLTVTVDSSMTAADHVRTIHVFSEYNPIATVVRFHLGPRAGVAKVSTSIRLATTQRITAIAALSDGSLWAGHACVVVTLAACIDGG